MKTKILGILILSLIAFAPKGFGAAVPADTTFVKVYQPEKPSMIYIVDGEEVTADEVDKLDLEDIEQMEYVTDKEKIRQYTDKEVETVVVVTLKDKDDPEEE